VIDNVIGDLMEPLSVYAPDVATARKAGRYVCSRFGKADAAELMDMLGLLDVLAPQRRVARVQRTLSGRVKETR
jgi:hypothetical protein